jgi:endonuclease YncB( thermonuclease family)
MDFAEFLIESGYIAPRRLDNGQWLAVIPMLFTTGLAVIDDGDFIGPCCRYCYRTRKDALRDLGIWDGQNDPPGPWVKQKPQDRLNPALADPDREF